jgi:uncharacterized protein with HEPN domain
LTDILEAADAIARFVQGIDEDRFFEDELRQSAVLHRLIVIGEAAARLPAEFLDRHPEIEWSDIVGFRNIAVHEYFSVNLSIVWVTAMQDVPALRERIAEILAAEYSNQTGSEPEEAP